MSGYLICFFLLFFVQAAFAQDKAAKPVSPAIQVDRSGKTAAESDKGPPRCWELVDVKNNVTEIKDMWTDKHGRDSFINCMVNSAQTPVESGKIKNITFKKITKTEVIGAITLVNGTNGQIQVDKVKTLKIVSDFGKGQIRFEDIRSINICN